MIQDTDSIPWVRCASGNVFFQLFFSTFFNFWFWNLVENLKFVWNPEIWLKSWSVVEILKYRCISTFFSTFFFNFFFNFFFQLFSTFFQLFSTFFSTFFQFLKLLNLKKIPTLFQFFSKLFSTFSIFLRLSKVWRQGSFAILRCFLRQKP